MRLAAFSSSRTLPGQSYSRNSHVGARSRPCARWVRAVERSCASSSQSPRRSRPPAASQASPAGTSWPGSARLCSPRGVFRSRIRRSSARSNRSFWGQIEERACEVPPGWPRLFGPAADDRIAFEIDTDDPERRRGVRGGSDRVWASREDNVASKCNKFTSQVKKPLDGVPRRSGALVFADPHLVHIFTVVHSSQIARRAAASEVRLVKTTVCQSTAPHPNKNP